MNDNFIVVKIMGGLGNQMFQYALGRAVATRHDARLLLDISGYGLAGDRRPETLRSFARQFQLDAFPIRAEIADSKTIQRVADHHHGPGLINAVVRRVRRGSAGFLFPKSHVREKRYTFDSSIEKIALPAYLDGFWQSPRYFARVAGELRAEFQFKDSGLREFARDFIARLKRQCSTLVALHVRRGDLAKATRENRPQIVYGAPVRSEYVAAARAVFPSSVGFLVFSDTAEDIQWCRQNIHGPNVFFSEGHSDLQDFELMRSCDHNIIANSTFSWWAAWLNATPGRRVVAPKEWSPPEKPNGIVTKDLLPPDWTVIDANEAAER